MGNMRHEEEKMINDVFERFINSYAERDKAEDFSNWLASRLQEELPDMPGEKSQQLSRDIIEAVAGYDRTLDNLNKAIDAGQSKEEWLSSQVIEAYKDLAPAEAGPALQQIANGLDEANTQLMYGISDIHHDADLGVDTEAIDWNEYSVKNETFKIGKQAVMSGLGAAADIIKQNLERGEPLDSDMLNQSLQEGIKAASGEVKAVVAGVIKTLAEKGLKEFLPEDTPLESICDMACVVVEGASALFDAVIGEGSITEVLDRIGRSSVAAVCRLSANMLEMKIKLIPKFGPIIAHFAGGLLEHMKSPQFSENVYTVVREAAIATWEGIKQRTKDLINMKNYALLEQLNN